MPVADFLSESLLFDVSLLFDNNFFSDVNAGTAITSDAKRLVGLLSQPRSTNSTKYHTAKSFIKSKGASEQAASTFALITLNLSAITGKTVMTLLRETENSGLTFNAATFDILNSIRKKQSQLFEYQEIDNLASLNRNIYYFYRNGPNYPPQFTSTPVTSATEVSLYTYNITVDDINYDDTLTIFSDSILPGWLSLVDNGDGTAVLSGIPQDSDTGNHSITLKVRDSKIPQLFDTQTFVINVIDINQPPSFTSTPVTDATEDTLYTYNITATDPDSADSLTFTSDSPLPGWLSLVDNGNGTAVLSGTPLNADVGPNNIDLRVTDDGTGNLSDTQSFTINVVNVNDPPQFDSTPVLIAEEESLYTYNVVTSDPDTIHGDVLSITADVIPSWLSLVDNGNGSGTLSGTPQEADIGIHNVTLRVTDSNLVFVTQSFQIEVFIAALVLGTGNSGNMVITLD